MLKYVDYDIVGSEVPDEITLGITLSNCPFRCRGCHSPQLRSDIGTPLLPAVLEGLLLRYGDAVTCVCFLGGDSDLLALQQLAQLVHAVNSTLKVAWYSGRTFLPSSFDLSSFQYIKLGGYEESLGPLTSRSTNQRFYRLTSRLELVDITHRFWKE
ncbi:MAG: 4Fe-4S cluster-binding domain-containing protein [Bacteroidaceae bacterium]|nr:anaerobic ribonucleoside-triphosphate reductase activating protein [Bacteroidaceae bacterium]